MKVRDVIKRLEQDGWQLVRTKGSHRQYRHPSKTRNRYCQDIRHWTFRQER